MSGIRTLEKQKVQDPKISMKPVYYGLRRFVTTLKADARSSGSNHSAILAVKVKVDNLIYNVN